MLQLLQALRTAVSSLAAHSLRSGLTMLGMIFVCVGLYAYRGGVPNPLGERRAVLCLRGAIGTSAIYAFFVTSAYLPLADAAVATFVSPLVTAAGASLILRETPPRGADTCSSRPRGPRGLRSSTFNVRNAPRCLACREVEVERYRTL